MTKEEEVRSNKVQAWHLQAAAEISEVMNSANRTHNILENPRDRYLRLARIISRHEAEAKRS